MTLIQQAVAITTAMETASGARPGSLTSHGALRLAALVPDEEIVFLEAFSSWADSSGGDFMGRVVLVTRDRVAVADSHPQRNVTDPSSRVRARTWARRPLRYLQMMGTDEAWARADDAQPLPAGCQIGLVYGTGDELALPLNPELGSSLQAAWALLPGLLEDLGASRGLT